MEPRETDPMAGKSGKARGSLDFGMSAADRAGAAPARKPRRTSGDAGSAPRRGKGNGNGKGGGNGRRGSGRRRKRRGGVFGFLRVALRTTFLLLVVGFLGVAGVLGYYAAKLPSVTSWEIPERPPNIKILASDGTLIANRGDTGGQAVKLSDLPPTLPQAVIAIEDRRFYTHFGVDPFGLMRAALSNLRAGDVVQGGSTLTQQLAKNLFLNPERTMERKIQEVVLALWLEARYSKDEILEMYLNRVYLGAGAYGVDAAARRYFGKPAHDLSLLEAATIAGLLKAPSRFAPSSNPTAALARAKLVLAAMKDAGFITDAQMREAAADTLTVPKVVAAGSAGYAADWAADLVPGFVGAIHDDIVVETTIDLKLQAEAAQAVDEALDKDGKAFGVRQGAMVAMETDGAVRVLVGGRDYAQSQFNRAVTARRQPGSSFKPFVYLTALEFGLAPETIRIDQPVNINGWKPENYTRGEYRGPVTLQRALALSLNTISAQLTDEVGPENVVATARRLGISSPLQANPSIALGTSEVSLLEMTGAFAPFANGGYGVIPYVIKRITTEKGKVLYERVGTGTGQVVAPAQVGMMNAMLRETLETGTGKKAVIQGWQAAGKTGTSQEWRDAWFIGYTAHMVGGVWFGNDDGKPTKKASGGNLPAAVWGRFMTEAHQGVQVAALPGNYTFRDAGHFADGTPPPQDIMGPNGRYDEYLDRYEPRLDEPAFDDGGQGEDGWSDDEPVANGDWQDDPRYARAPDARDYDPRYDPAPDPRYEPDYDPRYDRRYDPRYDAGAGRGGPVPPADVGNGVRLPPADIGRAAGREPPPRREGGFFRRLFGG